MCTTRRRSRSRGTTPSSRAAAVGHAWPERATLDEAVEHIGAGVTAVAGDITDPADLDRLYDTVRAHGRGLDVVFANAATASFATVDQITEQDYDRIFDVNVKGTLRTVQKALPLLNDGASVILNAATAAENGTPAFSVFAASKAAVRSFARTWANELKDRGIRVNAISPGPIDTSGITELVDPGNAAAAVAFLATADSSYMIGANLYVDGGENQI
ncbi:SDR family oxidoreductase [Crossiella sp. S99.1]|uniref:SDR family oxidoreductase n=1 Tax=Crossiella sp. S99.1 TaxID=2936271 RepID=UPI0027E59B36|nr:SDR family oxidoreductase [Crossiella sp. S99.1]